MKKQKCSFCETTDFFISEEHETPEGHFFVDVRFDIDEEDIDVATGHGRHEIDVNFGLLEGLNNSVSTTSWWTKALNIKYCPICGRKLK